MITDIFIRSYAGDIQWIPYALKSIHRFVSGIRDIIIVVPGEDCDAFNKLGLTKEILRTSRLIKFKDPYLEQQADKLYADLYTDADYILYWDSDTVAITSFSPSALMVQNKPRCLCTAYADLVDENGKAAVPWQSITAKAIGVTPEYEFMRAHPFLIANKYIVEFKRFISRKHGMSLMQYINAQPSRKFSEFNAIHAWAHAFHPNLFHWIDTKNGVPEPFVRQFWSWGGITPEVKAELDKLLS